MLNKHNYTSDAVVIVAYPHATILNPRYSHIGGSGRSYLDAKGVQLEDELDGEHTGEDHVQVIEYVRVDFGLPVELCSSSSTKRQIWNETSTIPNHNPTLTLTLTLT